jgi:hypothetical protein
MCTAFLKIQKSYCHLTQGLYVNAVENTFELIGLIEKLYITKICKRFYRKRYNIL